MAAVCWPPLVTPVHYDPDFKVTVRLHESLLSGTHTPADIKIQMMSLCAQLDLLCQKELVGQPGHRVDNGRTTSSFANRASVVYDEMKQTLIKANSQVNVQAYIESKWLDRLYPRAVAYIARPDNMSLALKQTTVDHYFTQLANLHHLETLARQMYNDVSTQAKPKYIAHQLAVLYQAIMNVQGNSTALAATKKNIEDNFKTIKAAFISDPDDAYLAPEIRDWLLTVTDTLVNLVSSLPAELTQEMKQPSSVLAQS